MSKLSELINKLCPNGVEYKKLGEIVEINKGEQLNKQMLLESGNYPVINGGVNPSGYWDKYNKEANLITISQGGASAGYVNWQRTRFWAGAHCFVLENPSDFILYRYLYFVVKKNESVLMGSQIGAGIPSLSAKTVSDLSIPLPPLEIQREVVEILDKFAQLTAELTAELEKRKKQYEHYRDKLLEFNDEVDWCELGDEADVTKLAGFEFTKYVKYQDAGSIIALRGLNVKHGHLVLDDVKYIDGSDLSMLTRSKLKIGDLMFTYVGTVGQVALVDKDDKYYLAPNVARIRFYGKRVLPEFMKYYFQGSQFFDVEMKKRMGSSSMDNLTMGNIRKFKIPLPSLAEQERIVAILDRFDSLCNSLTEGLPAEIALRKKQYEYYRDKLLSFGRTSSSSSSSNSSSSSLEPLEQLEPLEH